MAQLLRCDQGSISRQTKASDIKGWNSLNNVKLLLQLETTFKIRFSGLEASSLENVGELVDLIELKLAR